ncbi:MAG: CehA/McbA family metallohydrolase [Maricaulaceae bacterium]|jgi:hypothetical protein
MDTPRICAALGLAGALMTSAAPVAAHSVGPMGVETLDWHTDDISRAFAPVSVSNNFGRSLFNGQPAQSVEVAGQECVRSGLILLDVRDALAFDIDETVEVEIAFDLAASAGGATLAYDMNGAAGGEVIVDLPASDGEDSLHVAQLSLPRARFAGRGDLDTDIMIASQAGATVCDVRVARSYETTAPDAFGWLELTVRDEHGEATPARIGLYDETGRTPLPSEAAVEIEEFDDHVRLALLADEPSAANWPSDNPWILYTDGAYRARVPVGDYDLIAAKGLEYRIEAQTVRVEAGETAAVTVDLERWADLPGAGRYSGDVHIHRAQRDAEDSLSILRHAQAEDIHVANALEMGNAATTHYPQRAWGEDGRRGDGSYIVASGQEDPRTAARGHTIHLDLPEPVRDPSRYLLYHEVFERASELGAVSGYAHVFSPGGATRTDVGLAIDAPFDLVDFVEVLQSGLLGTDLWFDLLNLGYQIAPAAGSDYPYLGQIGSVRSYVRIDEDYSPDAWFDGLTAGRTFVTNGPIVSLQVNGADIGARLDLAAGDAISIVADASINPDIDLLERIELIEQGEVVAEAASAEGAEILALEYEATAEHGTWFVVRASGRTRTPHPIYGFGQTVLAISAPVYVSVDGDRTWKRDAVEALARERIALLDEFAETTFSLASGAEYWEDGETVLADWPGQLELLGPRIDQAKALYEELVRAAQ